MYYNPISLQELCLDTICANLDDVFEKYTKLDCEVSTTECFRTSSHKKYRFKQSDLFLYNEISEQLLLKLGEKKLLTDSTISLFTCRNTRLRNVKLKNCEPLTENGLKVLRGHKIEEFDCFGMLFDISEIIECFSDWSKKNLKVFHVPRCKFSEFSSYPVLVSSDTGKQQALQKLKNLQSLNVAYTEFDTNGFEYLKDCKLEKLDISCTRVTDLMPLVKWKETLTHLTIFDYGQNMKAKTFISTLLELENLKYLDISSENEAPTSYFTNVIELLMYYDGLPNLTFLDLSGKISIDVGILSMFIQKHPHLTYLGLVHSQVCDEDMFTNDKHPEYRENLIVAGTATESQIQVALKRYPHRPYYVQKCLYYLFRMTPVFKDARPDIIELVLPGMRNHPSHFAVQMAATACLYNLTKGELSLKIHPILLKQVVSLTLTAMYNFPHHYQLQKNSLLTLCSDRILQDVNFDKFYCAKLVMDSLCTFEDQSMNRMAVAICSILAAKISTAETSALGSKPLYMRKLLKMVQTKVSLFQVDITMKFTLSALWNLTDESATTCKVFLEEGGMELFLKVLETFTNDSTVETKVLGLINNIAEVSKLRKHLMINEFIQQLKNLLHSEQIDVSYFAAGIISHLASDGEASWTVTNISREEMLAELGDVVSKWKIPDGEMVAYRSFFPFFPLLKCPMDYPIQLWAVWAIHHVCTKNPKRYCNMLVTEGGVSLLKKISESEIAHKSIKHFSELILSVLDTEIPTI